MYRMDTCSFHPSGCTLIWNFIFTDQFIHIDDRPKSKLDQVSIFLHWNYEITFFETEISNPFENSIYRFYGLFSSLLFIVPSYHRINSFFYTLPWGSPALHLTMMTMIWRSNENHFTQARENGSEWKVKMGTADEPSLSVAWCFICILRGYFLSLHLHSSGFIEKWPFMCGKLDVLALIKNIKKPCKAELSYTSMLKCIFLENRNQWEYFIRDARSQDAESNKWNVSMRIFRSKEFS